jgi:hypothetical protein
MPPGGVSNITQGKLNVLQQWQLRSLRLPMQTQGRGGQDGPKQQQLPSRALDGIKDPNKVL